MKAPVALGYNMRARRKQLRLTQERLSELVGLSKNSIQAIESGRQWPTAATISAIAKALKMRETALFHDPDAPVSLADLAEIVARLARKPPNT